MIYTIFTIIIILVCVLLGGIVLIQNPKGGGLSATFGQAGNQLLGFKKSTDIVEKWTWYLAVALLVLCLGATATIDRTASAEQVQTTFEGADPSLAAPATTAPVPNAVPQPAAPVEEPMLDGEGG